MLNTIYSLDVNPSVLSRTPSSAAEASKVAKLCCVRPIAYRPISHRLSRGRAEAWRCRANKQQGEDVRSNAGVVETNDEHCSAVTHSSRAEAYAALHALPSCVLYEDQHVLVVNKPPGANKSWTHATTSHPEISRNI